MSRRRYWISWVLLWISAGLGPLSSAASDLEAPEQEVRLEVVPEPSLEAMEPGVRDVLRAAWQDLSRLGADQKDRARLAAIHGETGLLYHGFGLESLAAICYRNATRLDPTEPKWLYLSAVLAQGYRDLEAARELFERVLELDATHVPSLLRSAEVLRLQGRVDEAEARFQGVLNDPVLSAPGGTGAYALWALAKIANARGEATRAVKLLSAAIDQQPEADALYHALALAYRRLGDREKAVEASAGAGARRVRFEDPWSELVRPAEGATAQLLLGNARLRAGSPDAALPYHRRAHQLSPEDPAVIRALALTLEELGETQEALDLYAEAGRLSATNPLYLYDWARAAFKAGVDPEQVAPELERVLETAPDFLNAHLLLATCLTQMGDVSAAMASLRRALELSPGEPRATTALAGLWARRAQESLSAGDVSATIQSLERAVELAPTEAVLWFNLGRTLMSNGDFEAAADHLQTALASAQEESLASQIRLKLAVALLFAGREEEGTSILLAWVEQPASPVAALTLAAQVLAAGPESQRDERRAVGLARQGFETQPTPEGAETMALALASAGDFSTAIQWQERLLEQMRALQADSQTLLRMERNLERYRGGRRGLAPWQTSEAGENDTP